MATQRYYSKETVNLSSTMSSHMKQKISSLASSTYNTKQSDYTSFACIESKPIASRGPSAARRREGVSSSRRLASQSEREAEEIAQLERENQELLNSNPLTTRKFTSISASSNAIQVEWNHPNGLNSKERKVLYYVL